MHNQHAGTCQLIVYVLLCTYYTYSQIYTYSYIKYRIIYIWMWFMNNMHLCRLLVIRFIFCKRQLQLKDIIMIFQLFLNLNAMQLQRYVATMIKIFQLIQNEHFKMVLTNQMASIQLSKILESYSQQLVNQLQGLQKSTMHVCTAHI